VRSGEVGRGREESVPTRGHGLGSDWFGGVEGGKGEFETGAVQGKQGEEVRNRTGGLRKTRPLLTHCSLQG